MYKAEIDNLMLFQTDILNGMRYVENPVLNLAVSSVESFQFTIYPGHRLYDKIGCMKSLVKVWQDEKLIFYGRITGYSEEMYGVKTYDCEGAMTWLNDEVLSRYSMSGMTPENAFRNYISMYNQKITDPSHKFSVGKVTVFKTAESGKDGVIHRASALRPSFWNEISEKLIQPLGGFLRIQYKAEEECAGVIDWLAAPDETCTQEVQYAKNLMGCDRKIDGTAVVTAVVPLGGSKGESGGEEVRETISQLDDLNVTAILHSFLSDDLEKSGDMIYSKSGVQEYGFIKRTITWDDADAGTLIFSAGEWLLQNGKLESTIDVEAIDVADIDGDVSHFQCGNYVKVRLPGEKSTMTFPITAIEIPISNPESGRLFVGAQTYGIADTRKSGTAGGYSESGGAASSHTHANKTILDAIEEPYTTEEKEKLSGLENYTHPTHTSYSSGFYKITTDSGHVVNAEPVVKEDITALGIPGDIPIYSVAVNASYGYSEGAVMAVIIVNGTAHPICIPIAGESKIANSGLISESDYEKLSGIETGATKTVVDSALSGTSTNPVQNKTVVAEFTKTDAALADILNVYGSKNLFAVENTTVTERGLTFTWQDGVLSVSGACTTTGDVYIPTHPYTTSNSANQWRSDYNCIFNSISDGTNALSVTLHLYMPDGSQVYTRASRSGHNISAGTRLCGMYFTFTAGIEYDFTVKPMLRLASVKDDTFVPYVPTNAELAVRVAAIEMDTGWIDFIPSDIASTSSIRYRKIGNCVRLNGYAAVNTSQSSSTLIGKLPEGYRPLYPSYSSIAHVTANSKYDCTTTVLTDGSVIIARDGALNTAMQFAIDMSFLID